MFLRKSRVQRDPLAVTMSGVRLGERVLQIVGVGDAGLAALIASKAGLTGTAAIIANDKRAAERASGALADAGALADVLTAAGPRLPFSEAAFDVAVIHSDATRSRLHSERTEWLLECHRVLRGGGRLIIIEGTKVGLRAFFGSRHSGDSTTGRQPGGTDEALKSARFRAVRVLADREGFKFTEGLKTE